ncbi:hypothetical protein Dda_6327 [Drechslerella dactyloides]|uniref:Endo-chitosanase n=1 Tax=Drechslerella dactyloides TaxID=74499 RepID=A0AAD6IXL4_DREDA|nr:hypothetical protein Dda_6327 [Drechslerella dactyloides]
MVFVEIANDIGDRAKEVGKVIGEGTERAVEVIDDAMSDVGDAVNEVASVIDDATSEVGHAADNFGHGTENIVSDIGHGMEDLGHKAENPPTPYYKYLNTMVVIFVILTTLLAVSASGWSVPLNIQNFYSNVKDGGCRSFAGGKNNLNDGQGNSGFGFCTDTANVVYLSGRSSLGDMDVDCDGARNCGGLSGDFQAETAFDDILKGEDYGIKTLDASIHQFSVLGTCHVDLTGIIRPLALVAVVCNKQLLYSIWGDTNGCDDDDFTGEASVSLAQMCFPNEGLNGNNGHEPHDVLYLAFTGTDAVVGPRDANWKAKSASEFQRSLKAFGDSIIKKKFGTSSPSPNPSGSPETGHVSCTWIGHCAGAKCTTSDDCDGDLQCKKGVCAVDGDRKPPTCSWVGQCLRARCKLESDCANTLVRASGKCLL